MYINAISVVAVVVVVVTGVFVWTRGRVWGVINVAEVPRRTVVNR